MDDIKDTRFIAANYFNLQGLKSVPYGLLLTVVIYWANAQQGPASDLTFPLVATIVIAGLAWLIHKYYRLHFGNVAMALKQRRAEAILSVTGSLVGLLAFIVDTKYAFPVSFIGLLWALAILGEYIRLQWFSTGHYLLPGTLLYFTVMLVVSVLPLLGVTGWWEWMGLRSHFFAVLATAGMISVTAGLLGHWIFVSHLPRAEG